ncbi:MAG: hypothetical protein AB9866_02985 [Syntrophobacteraceae bacterium]
MKFGKLAPLAVVVSFAILLIIPHIVELSGVRSGVESTEKRKTAPMPYMSLMVKSFPVYAARFERFYGDAFGLRQELIRLNNRLRLLLFSESPLAGVRVGREGWLFYADEWALEDYENLMPYKPRDLEKIKQTIEERRLWLEQRGIKFFILMAPEKHSIYGEYLPPEIQKIAKDSRVDQVANYLASDPGIEFIDLREALLRAKPLQRLYHRTDSHWNDYGAFIGYATLMERIRKYFPAVKKPSIEAYTVSISEGSGGDLAAMLLLSDVIKEERITLTPKLVPKAIDGSRPYRDPVDSGIYPGREMVIKETNNLGLPKALIFRDSFAGPLIPLVAESFQSAVFVWTHEFIPELVELEKPDIVIFEIVERYTNALF